MKKLILTIALTLVASGAAFAQGQINFNNRTNEFGFGDSRPVTFQDTGTGVVGQNYVAQLYYASDAANLSASAAIVEAPSVFRVPTTLSPGTWTGATKNFVGAGATQGATVSLIVRVWDSTLFGSYEAAYNGGGLVGQFTAFNYLVPASGSAPGAYIMNNFQGFAIAPVPEPSTIALGILGAGSLLFLRRKK